MEVDELWNLEFCNEKDLNQHNPKIESVKES
jgi:hypothetical protein